MSHTKIYDNCEYEANIRKQTCLENKLIIITLKNLFYLSMKEYPDISKHEWIGTVKDENSKIGIYQCSDQENK